ncbi:MAG: TonB-dependent receptor [Chlorobiales bacterium]
MRHWIYLTLVFLLDFIVPINAQPSSTVKSNEYRLYGKVVDAKTQELLFGATVVALPLKRGKTTNLNGTYSLLLPKGNYEIQVRFVGYRSQSLPLALTSDTELNIALEPDVIKAEEITVSTDREKEQLMESSQSLDVMTKEDLDAHRGQTFGESLKNLAGVSVLQTGISISKPVIRGLHSQRVLIINAGIRQEGQQWGAEHAPEIDPFSASEIQLLRGAASVEYGADAIGGVIRSEPKPLPASRSLDGEVMLNAFSNNRQGAISGFLEGGFENGLGWRIQGSLRKAGNYASPTYTLANSGFQEQNFSTSLGLTRDFGRFTLYFSRFDTELGIFSGSHIGNTTDLLNAILRGNPATSASFSYTIDLPKQTVTHYLFSFHSDIPLSIGRLDMRYGWQHNHRREFDLHKGRRRATPDDPPAYELDLWTYNADIKFHHQPFGRLIGTVGISGTTQFNTNSGTSFLIPNFEAYTGGIFLFEELVYEQWILNGGFRYDYRTQSAYTFTNSKFLQSDAKRNFQTATLSTGVIYQLLPTLSLAFNAGTAWRPPSINELYSYGVHHGTAQFEIGDSTLSVEQSLNIDGTLRYESSRFSAEVSVYRNLISNFIYLFPLSEPIVSVRGAFPSFRYEQANARLYGIDASFKWLMFDDLRIEATLSAVRADNLERREPIYQMPSDRLTLLAHYHLPDGSLLKESFLEVGMTLVRRQNRFPTLPVPETFPPLFPNEAAYREYLVLLVVPPAGYALFNFSVGTKISIAKQSLLLSLSIENLLNQRYRDYLSRFRYFADDVGRNIILRFNVPFGTT